jgi:hypothetical protein
VLRTNLQEEPDPRRPGPGIRRFVGTALAVLLAITVAPVAVRAASNVVTLVGPGVTQQSKGAKVDSGSLRVGSLTKVVANKHVDCGDPMVFSFETKRTNGSGS